MRPSAGANHTYLARIGRAGHERRCGGAGIPHLWPAHGSGRETSLMCAGPQTVRLAARAGCANNERRPREKEWCLFGDICCCRSEIVILSGLGGGPNGKRRPVEGAFQPDDISIRARPARRLRWNPGGGGGGGECGNISARREQSVSRAASTKWRRLWPICRRSLTGLTCRFRVHLHQTRPPNATERDGTEWDGGGGVISAYLSAPLARQIRVAIVWRR